MIHLTASQVPATLRISGQCRAVVCETVTIPATAGMWDGGSRDTYRAIRIADGAELPLCDGDAAWNGTQRDRTITLQPGIAVVRSTTFQGRAMAPTIYICAADAAPILPVQVELSPFERCVLRASVGLKSSYNGMDRYALAKQECVDYSGKLYEHGAAKYGITEAFPTRAQWDEAKAALIGRGLLNKAGAVTTAGRNADAAMKG